MPCPLKESWRIWFSGINDIANADWFFCLEEYGKWLVEPLPVVVALDGEALSWWWNWLEDDCDNEKATWIQIKKIPSIDTPSTRVKHFRVMIFRVLSFLIRWMFMLRRTWHSSVVCILCLGGSSWSSSSHSQKVTDNLCQFIFYIFLSVVIFGALGKNKRRKALSVEFMSPT